MKKVALTVALTLVALVVVGAVRGGGDCYPLDVGKVGDPMVVLVSDSTEDGLCHE